MLHANMYVLHMSCHLQHFKAVLILITYFFYGDAFYLYLDDLNQPFDFEPFGLKIILNDHS